MPQQYSQMIDKSSFPEDRLASITGIQYQLVLQTRQSFTVALKVVDIKNQLCY